jgi:hypothetical protein
MLLWSASSHCVDRTLKLAMTASSHILSNSPFIMIITVDHGSVISTAASYLGGSGFSCPVIYSELSFFLFSLFLTRKCQDSTETFWSPKLGWTLKYSVPSTNKMQGISITKISYLMLFKEIIAVYYENDKKPIDTLCGKIHSCWTSKQLVHIVTTRL